MAKCYNPIPAFRAENKTVTLWPPLGKENLALPCETCIGCKTRRALNWANRCMHETKNSPYNTFITLTYDDNNLPGEGQLDAEGFQRFLKRLRRAAEYRRDIVRLYPYSIRYFACGEYGETTDRPHYHAILFNCDFADRKPIKGNRHELTTSNVLRELWPHGNNSIGNATGRAANYIAQYAVKSHRYGGLIEKGMEVTPDGVVRRAPFLRMSLRPAIGEDWLTENKNDLAKGFWTRDGRKQRIPRHYLTRLEKLDPHLHEEITTRRVEHQNENLEAARLIHLARRRLTTRRGL